MMIQYEPKHVAILSDILYELGLCLTGVFYSYLLINVQTFQQNIRIRSPYEENDNKFHLRIKFLNSGTKAWAFYKYC